MNKETEDEESLCPTCGYRVHPCLPCEEVIALNRDDELEDLPLITNRHYNTAHEVLGKVYRVKTDPSNEYPEIGCVEVQNAVKIVANLCADVEHNREKLKGLTIPVLDKGYCRLIDYMGSDKRICESARISYKSPSKGNEADKKLITYLWKNKHTSPFEQISITYDIKLPLFVQGQMVRHRTQRLNQVSARYTEVSKEFYIPKEWRKQDTKNKQGSIAEENWNSKAYYREICSKNQDLSANLENHCIASYDLYQEMLKGNVAREMARMVLPQNFYTEIYTNWDLHNLMHFFTLRLDEHAQFEIREYAKAMYDIAKKLYPWTIAAYDRYKWTLVDLEKNK